MELSVLNLSKLNDLASLARLIKRNWRGQKMNIFTRLLCGLALFSGLFVGEASAEKIKVYTGVGVGAYSLNYSASTAGDIKTETVLGGYVSISADWNPYLATEFRYGYANAGNIEKNGVPMLNQTATLERFYSYLVKPQYPLVKYGHVYVLLGISSAKVVYRNGVFERNTISSDYSLGAGLKLHFFDRLALAAEAVRYTGKKDFVANKAAVYGYSMQLSYMFD